MTLGTVDDVVAAIAHGADVAVGIAGEDYRERVRCDSLRVDTSTSGTRAACLSLVQLQGNAMGLSTGHYEGRVYNTNGIEARVRVAFGTTTNSDEAATRRALTWFVRDN